MQLSDVDLTYFRLQWCWANLLCLHLCGQGEQHFFFVTGMRTCQDFNGGDDGNRFGCLKHTSKNLELRKYLQLSPPWFSPELLFCMISLKPCLHDFLMACRCPLHFPPTAPARPAHGGWSGKWDQCFTFFISFWKAGALLDEWSSYTLTLLWRIVECGTKKAVCHKKFPGHQMWRLRLRVFEKRTTMSLPLFSAELHFHFGWPVVQLLATATPTAETSASRFSFHFGRLRPVLHVFHFILEGWSLAWRMVKLHVNLALEDRWVWNKKGSVSQEISWPPNVALAAESVWEEDNNIYILICIPWTCLSPILRVRLKYISRMIHGTGRFTYMNGWFVWFELVGEYTVPVPWILWVYIYIYAYKSQGPIDEDILTAHKCERPVRS